MATKEEMDDAAEKAESELMDNHYRWNISDIANWWKRWYLKTGHKRLGRIILLFAKESQ